MPFGEEYSPCKNVPPDESPPKTSVSEGFIISPWDLNLMCMAKFFGHFSKCMSRHIGAIIAGDKRIISTGYNGPPEGTHHCDSDERYQELRAYVVDYSQGRDDKTLDTLEREWGTRCPRQIMDFRSGEGLHLCPAAHAETNAIVNAARDGSVVKGATMYCYCPMPCFECTKLIINAGIRKVFFLGGSSYDRWAPLLFSASNTQLVHVQQELVDRHYISLSLI